MGQNYTKTNLHRGSILHKDTFEQRQICTRGKNCTKTILQGGWFCTSDSFEQRVKGKNQREVIKKKQKKKKQKIN